jgi:hypothetical protein
MGTIACINETAMTGFRLKKQLDTGSRTMALISRRFLPLKEKENFVFYKSSSLHKQKVCNERNGNHGYWTYALGTNFSGVGGVPLPFADPFIMLL